jgi:hypothetical protein
MSAMGPRGTIRHGPGFAVTSFANTFISVWRQQANLRALHAVREEQEKLVASSPGGIALVTVMEPVSVKPLSSVERAAAAALLRDFAPSTLASAYVFEGEGFRPAMSRAAVAGVMLFSRVKYPSKVFSTVADGANWIIKQGDGAVPAPEKVAELMRAVEDTRREIGL